MSSTKKLIWEINLSNPEFEAVHQALKNWKPEEDLIDLETEDTDEE